MRTACSVLVENVPDDVITNKQLLELYFDKWGGPVEEISTNPEEQTIIVKFRSQDGMKQVFFSPETFNHSISAALVEFNRIVFDA